MKDITLQRCRHFTTGGSLLTALFHFVCCGLPTLSVILNGSITTGMKPHFLSHQQMGYMLLFSGLLLAVSFYFTYQKNCCIAAKKSVRICQVILYFSLALYATAVYFHIHQAETMLVTEMSCH